MSNSQFRIVPHRSWRVSRKVFASAEQEANFIMLFERFFNGWQKYVLIILGRYGENIVRHSRSDLNHCFSAANSVEVCVCVAKSLLLIKKSNRPRVQTVIRVDDAEFAGINFRFENRH